MDRHLVFPCLKRVLCALCAIMLCLAALPNAARAEEDYSYTYPDDYSGIIDPSVPYDPLLAPNDIPPEEWHTGNSMGAGGFSMMAFIPQMVPASYSYPRVLLSTSSTSVDVVFFGNYCLYDTTGQAMLVLVPRTVYTFAVTDSTVSLSAGGALLYSAEQFDIREHTPPAGQNKNYFTLYNTAYGVNLCYYGSLSAHYNSGLKLVNRVYIDDYLCGVVPNEIGDGFGAAALGAQAIAARNYAYSRLSSSTYYDLGDTSTYQVYKGFSSATNTPAAVAATNGQILYYGSTPLQNIYYGASNGGVTELTCHRWTIDHSYPPYVEIVNDPFDLKYSQNYGSNSYMEEITVTQTGDSKGMLRAMLKNVLELNDTEAGAIQFDTVTLSADCLHNINYIDKDGKACNFAGFQEIYRGVKGPDATYCSHFSTLTAVVSGSYINASGQTCMLTDQTITITENILGNGNYGFKNSNLSCFWLVDNKDGTYTVRRGRYGHGIGMSQIGARQMGAEGKSAEFILTYYYPNTTLAVSSNYTPAETLTALPTTLSNDARAVASDNFVYAAANTNSIRLGIAKAGSTLIVTGENDEFYTVNYNVGQGYVAKTAFTPVYGKIKIVNVDVSCNVRSGPSTSYAILGKALKDANYTLLDANAAIGWYKINYNGSAAYVSAQYAALVANAPTPIITYPITVTPPVGFTDITLWVDGVPAVTTKNDGMLTAEVYATTAKTVTMYQYDNNIPVDMFTWTLSYAAPDGYTATALPELQNLLSYEGCAIRVTGVTGLRFISGIDENLRTQLLTTAGVGGYRLKEYGTVGINGALMTYYPFTKGAPGTGFGISYDSQNDVSIDKQDGRIWYASVMTNIPVESYKTKQGFRAYAILERSGAQYTFYGPQIDRSLYYVATQVMAANEFAEGTDAYAFVKGIIDAADAGGGG